MTLLLLHTSSILSFTSSLLLIFLIQFSSSPQSHLSSSSSPFQSSSSSHLLPVSTHNQSLIFISFFFFSFILGSCADSVVTLNSLDAGTPLTDYQCPRRKPRWLLGEQILGVFLVKMKNAFVPVKRDNSVNTHSRISTVPRGSEQNE